MEHNPKFSTEKILSGREAKEEALKQEIDISGKDTDFYKETIPQRMEDLMSEALEQNQEWIDNKLDKINAELPEDSKISFQEAYDAFKIVFKKRIKQQYKLSGDKTETWLEKVNLEEIFDQTVFDFIQSLKASVLRGDKKKSALRFGSLSHLLNPNIIYSLRKKYPEVGRSVINQAALNYSSDPENFINTYLENVKFLKEEHPDIDFGVINQIASSYPQKFESAINIYIKNVEDMSKRYPEIDISVIKHSAIHSLNKPGVAIESYILRKKNLEEKYPELSQTVISHVALHSPRDPEKFINSYFKKAQSLKEQYPQLSQIVIDYLAIHNPAASDAYIKKRIESGDFNIQN